METSPLAIAATSDSAQAARTDALPAGDLPELLDIKAVCRLLGGSRPLNPASVYRQITARRLPAPIKVSPSSSRWLRSEILAAIMARMGERDGSAA